MNLLVYYYKEYREKVIRSLEKHLDRDSIEKASRDPHCRRRPRPCGLTVHTGVGCPYQCRYCYIYSMGFSKSIVKYPLTPIELAYSISLNKNIVLGEYGTFLALGSVTEPFHPATREYSIELIRVLGRYLKNPIQVSTKEYLDHSSIEKLRNSVDKLSILYTITTLKWADTLEPYAPPPEKRFEAMANISRRGLHVTLFLRPFIPGATDMEIREILKMSREHLVDKIVVGTLRVNKSILTSIKSASQELYNYIKPYLPEKIDNVQRSIRAYDVKKYIVNMAYKYGFKIFPSACAATIDAYNQACYMCKYGPCGDSRFLPKISDSDVKDFMEYLGYKPINIVVDRRKIKVVVKDRKVDPISISYLKTISKRSVETTLL